MPDGILLCANEALFNYILTRYFTANAQDFSGAIIEEALDTELEFAATQAPAIGLSPANGDANFAISFSSIDVKIYDYQNGERGNLTDESTVQLTITGNLALSGQSIGMTSLTATGGGGQDNRAVARLVNKYLLPKYTSEVQKIPLPDLTAIVGFAVKVTGLKVAGDIVQVTADLSGSEEAASPAATMSNLAAPAVFAAVSGAALQQMIQSSFSPKTKTVSTKKSKMGFGYRGSASVTASNPRVKITEGKASGTIDGSASASGGIEAFGHWKDASIGVSVSAPPLGLKLDQQGAAVYVKPCIDEHFSLHFDFPGLLGKVADDILDGISSIADDITDALNDALGHISIKAFTVPTTVPGTDYPVSLSLDGLGFSGNSLVATVRVD